VVNALDAIIAFFVWFHIVAQFIDIIVCRLYTERCVSVQQFYAPRFRGFNLVLLLGLGVCNLLSVTMTVPLWKETRCILSCRVCVCVCVCCNTFPTWKICISGERTNLVLRRLQIRFCLLLAELG
jgi:hypothetical protein